MPQCCRSVAADPPAPYNAPPFQGAEAVESSQDSISFATVRRQASWVVAGQVLVAVVAGLICYAWRDARSGLSALAGGGIGAAATLTQVLVGLRNSAGKEPKEVIQGFYRGSAVKLVVTVVLFVLVLRTRALAPEPLFVTYVVTFLVYWVALARNLTGRG